MYYYKIIATIAILLFMFSCRSVQYVPVESVRTVRDSVVMRDSIVWHERVRERDSVVTRDSVVLVVDASGNVVRTELYRQKEVYRELREEYDRLMAAYKRLEAEKIDSVQVPYPVEKKLTRWQQTKVNYGGWAMGIVFFTILVVVGYMVYKLKK